MSDFAHHSSLVSHPALLGQASPEARVAVALGVISLILGFGAVVVGACVGLIPDMPVVELPGGFSTTDRGLVAMIMSGSGALTTLLGGICLHQAQEM